MYSIASLDCGMSNVIKVADTHINLAIIGATDRCVCHRRRQGMRKGDRAYRRQVRLSVSLSGAIERIAPSGASERIAVGWERSRCRGQAQSECRCAGAIEGVTVGCDRGCRRQVRSRVSPLDAIKGGPWAPSGAIDCPVSAVA